MAALGVCLGAFLVHAGAWHAGYGANASGLLGCHLLRLLLVLVAWTLAVSALKTATTKDNATSASGFSVLDTVGLSALILTGCMGWYPIWPVVLLLWTLPLFMPLVFSRKLAGVQAAGGLHGPVILRLLIGIFLFTLTWYLCASVSRQAFHGLGARIEAKGGADKLKAWAAGVIATHKQREQAMPATTATLVGLVGPPMGNGLWLAASTLIAGGPRENLDQLSPEEIPNWVEDLIGPFQGTRSIALFLHPGGVIYGGNDPCVIIWTGSSAYHFQILVRPSRISLGPPPWWWGEVGNGLEWRPGITLGTQGK